VKSESIAFGVAGIVFGLIAGWIIGSQQAGSRPPAPVAAQAQAQSPAGPAPVILDEAKVTAFRSVAEREPTNARPRAELGKMYFDAERYDDSIKWFSEAAKLAPKDVDISTDLGVSLYYTNQTDKALAQFDQSLKLDPKNAKTLLHIGIVRAFAKQDLAGAQAAWEQVVDIAPDSFEGQQAKRALESIRSAHPGGAATKPGA
jgi:cytochrome c-type biogenesis protein CcmH/NrfG